jgi:hypothetical protein
VSHGLQTVELLGDKGFAASVHGQLAEMEQTNPPRYQAALRLVIESAKDPLFSVPSPTSCLSGGDHRLKTAHITVADWVAQASPLSSARRAAGLHGPDTGHAGRTAGPHAHEIRSYCPERDSRAALPTSNNMLRLPLSPVIPARIPQLLCCFPVYFFPVFPLFLHPVCVFQLA